MLWPVSIKTSSTPPWHTKKGSLGNEKVLTTQSMLGPVFLTSLIIIFIWTMAHMICMWLYGVESQDYGECLLLMHPTQELVSQPRTKRRVNIITMFALGRGWYNVSYMIQCVLKRITLFEKSWLSLNENVVGTFCGRQYLTELLPKRLCSMNNNNAK